ncbi:MAG TPA: SDR family oxidoreductase [Pseudomonadales bacterium]|nr:SDR family oxidoreductase [Pseudomonadales bacterium]
MNHSSQIFQPHLLQGQTAVISGGSSGINLGIAKLFAQHDANVVIVARNQEKIDAAIAQLNKLGEGKVLGFSADVREFSALEQVAKQVSEQLGKIDIVIAGAAGNFLAPASTLSANGFGSVVDIDLKGTFNLFRACFEHLHTPNARLLAISAPQAQHPMPLQSHAGAAKAGIELLIKTLALEWGHHGIRINGISPGAVENTEGWDRLSKGVDDSYTKILPIPRVAKVEEMADLALFLVTPISSYMTGQIIALDGGLSMLGSGAMVAKMMGM